MALLSSWPGQARQPGILACPAAACEWMQNTGDERWTDCALCMRGTQCVCNALAEMRSNLFDLHSRGGALDVTVSASVTVRLPAEMLPLILDIDAL